MPDELPLPWRLQILERELRSVAIDSPSCRERLFALADRLAAIRCPHCKFPAPATPRPVRRYWPAVALAIGLLAIVAGFELLRSEQLANRLDMQAAEQRRASEELREQMVLELRRIRAGAAPHPDSEMGNIKPPTKGNE